MQIIRLIVCCETKKCKQIFFWFDVCFACDHVEYLILSKFDSHCFVDLNSECFTCAFFLTSKFFEMIFFHMFCKNFWIDASVLNFASNMLIWKIIIVVTFASNLLIWKNIIIVIFASKFVFLEIFNQFALKIWKSSSWMIQKKHDLMISLFVALMIDS